MAPSHHCPVQKLGSSPTSLGLLFLLIYSFFFSPLPAPPKSPFRKLTPLWGASISPGTEGAEACDRLLSPISVHSLDSNGFDVLLMVLLCSRQLEASCHLGLTAEEGGARRRSGQSHRQGSASPAPPLSLARCLSLPLCHANHPAFKLH